LYQANIIFAPLVNNASQQKEPPQLPDHPLSVRRLPAS
jgi:hypothetical protein